MVFDFSNLNIDMDNIQNMQNLQNLDISSFVDMEQMNKLVNAANEFIRCGPECQKKTKIGSLKKEYEDLQKKDTDYDEKLAKAKKAYYVAAFGDAAFQKEAKKDIAEAAKKSAAKLKKEIDVKLLQLETAFDSMEKAKLNKELTKELVTKIIKENKNMVKVIEKDENEAAIDQRLAVYEYNHLTTVNFFNSLIGKLLIGVFVVYLGLFIYFKLGYSRFNIAFLVFLGVLIFLNYFIAMFKSLFNSVA
jgi:membrane-associated HD superfamily phosphohydrolase